MPYRSEPDSDSRTEIQLALRVCGSPTSSDSSVWLNFQPAVEKYLLKWNCTGHTHGVQLCESKQDRKLYGTKLKLKSS